MKKSAGKNNQKLVERLRSEDDIKAVQSALDRNVAVVFDEASGQYVGEVVSQNRGASWIGRRYGRDFPHDSAEFTEQDDAVRFVGQALDPINSFSSSL